MKISYIFNKLVFVFLSVVLIGSVACSDDKPRNQNNSTTGNNTANNTNTNNTNTGTNNITVNNNNHQGAEDKDASVDIGFFNGSWRVVSDDADKTPFAYFDLVHDKDDAQIDGTYEAAIGLGEQIKGQQGDIFDGQDSSGVLNAKFNPFNQEGVYYLIQSTEKVSENELKGYIESDDKIDKYNVIIYRQLP